MSLSRIVDGFSSWLDMTAEAIVAAIARLRNARAVQLVEEESGAFSLRAAEGAAHPPFSLAEMPESLAAELRGREVELVLQPSRFLFRPLELPKRAAEFLAGIVRAQIDRLTPWSPAEAVFGWTAPADLADERIGLTVAATARGRIEPHVAALKAAGAKSVRVSTAAPVDGAAAPVPVRVFELALSGALGLARVRQALLVLLIAATAAASLATFASQIAGAGLDAELDALNERIGTQRRVLMAGRDGNGAGAALRALEQRKQDSPATVLVLEALSRVLPDHTYVTEMHVEGDRVQVIGVSQEAPSLIRLMEDSARFTEATFFAPTTRVPQDPGERFHIEARIKLPFEARP